MLTLTDTARGKLEEVIAQQAQHGAKVYGLRLSAYAGCCSGPQFGMSLAEGQEEGDWVGEFGGVRVLVDPASAPMLEGAHIDFVETLERTGFTIQPAESLRAGGACGCRSDAADGSGASGGGCGCGGR
jgi:iron-sulfur cluster assembly protein